MTMIEIVMGILKIQKWEVIRTMVCKYRPQEKPNDSWHHLEHIRLAFYTTSTG